MIDTGATVSAISGSIVDEPKYNLKSSKCLHSVVVADDRRS